MYRLDRFHKQRRLLCYTVPWARIVGNDPAIVLNKDGSMQTTFTYRGPDLDSAVKEQLSYMTQQINNLLMGMDTGWVLWFEAQRLPTT